MLSSSFTCDDSRSCILWESRCFLPVHCSRRERGVGMEFTSRRRERQLFEEFSIFASFVQQI
jgi:hypothetical protein